MVVEFTSLQGKIGRLMYEKEGGDKDVATAIEDHYKPQGPSDRVPTNPVAVTVALADKIDSLATFWLISELPTGSKDPFALRRAALGFANLMETTNKPISMGWLLTRAMAMAVVATAKTNFLDKTEKLRPSLTSNVLSPEVFTMAIKENLVVYNEHLDYWASQEGIAKAKIIAGNLLGFILDRLKVHLREQGVSHDHIEAVFALGGDDLVDITNRVKALGAFLSTDDGANLLAGYKRAANILKAEAKKGELPDVEPHKGTQPQEGVLFSALATAEPLIEKTLASEDYAGAMTALAGLRAPIDAFFDDVIVNSDVAAERENRLGLLIKIRNLAGTIADFDKVEG